MCDSLPPTTSLLTVVKFRPLRFSFCCWEPKSRAFSCLTTSICSNGCNSDEMAFRNDRAFHSFKEYATRGAIFCAFGSQNGRFDYELGLEEEGASRLHFESSESDSTLETLDAGLSKLNGFASTKAKMNDRRRYDDAMELPSLDFLESKDDFKEGKRNGESEEGLEEEVKLNGFASTKAKMNDRRRYDDAMELPSLDFLESKDDFKEGKRNGESEEGLEEEVNMVPVEDSDTQVKESGRYNGEVEFRRKRQVMRRSGILAKQVISIQSARSLGFVSQLWVDTAAWMVISLEVKPNLLSGESEWFLLEDVTQVGDVVLIQDETVIENEFKMIGLETLVGYKVVTPGLRTIGKIRGYSFNINSGAVESLELDSFGISIIPSTLISTYSLLVEDVLEVVSDSVVVDEAAASRIQRLSRGFLGTQNVGNSKDVDFREYGEAAVSDSRWRKKRSCNRQKYEEWDYPKDYL